MKKLSLDDLSVESFVTTPEEAPGRGTVRGHVDDPPQLELAAEEPGGESGGFTGASCFTNCTCEWTCLNTCRFTCHDTCGVGCS